MGNFQYYNLFLLIKNINIKPATGNLDFTVYFHQNQDNK